MNEFILKENRKLTRQSDEDSSRHCLEAGDKTSDKKSQLEFIKEL